MIMPMIIERSTHAVTTVIIVLLTKFAPAFDMTYNIILYVLISLSYSIIVITVHEALYEHIAYCGGLRRRRNIRAGD